MHKSTFPSNNTAIYQAIYAFTVLFPSILHINHPDLAT